MDIDNKKVGIVGAGAVGASAAYALAMQGICNEIVLFDIDTKGAEGKAIDIAQACKYNDSPIVIKAVETADMMVGCDIVIITAGVPRKSDMTRADLLNINASIVKDVTLNIKQHSPDAIIICVSNPLDVMTYVVHAITRWPRERIIGMGGALDSARMAYQISKQTGTNITQIDAMVIGDHGEHMLPLVSHAKVNNEPLESLLPADQLDEVIQKTKQGGAELVSYLGTSAYYAPGQSIAVMVRAILGDTREIIPASSMLRGEYGHEDVTVGVPCKIGASGITEIVEIELSQSEREKFDKSVESIRENIEILKSSNFFDGN